MHENCFFIISLKQAAFGDTSMSLNSICVSMTSVYIKNGKYLKQQKSESNLQVVVLLRIQLTFQKL